MLEVPLFIDPGAAAVHTLNGLFRGIILFMIASGLTIIFGVLGILNLAHGEFYGLGAFLLTSIATFLVMQVAAPTDPLSIAVFGILIAVAVLISAAILIPISGAIEAVFVRPIYDRAEMYQLLLTYALLLILVDTIRIIWGSQPVRPGTVEGQQIHSALDIIPMESLFGFQYSSVRIFTIFIGIGAFLFLLWFFDRTKTGRIVRATAIDREAATAIGVSSDRVFTLVFALGGFFAGFSGALYSVSAIPATAEMGGTALVLSFVVIVIGGLGSIRGSFYGAILVGIVWSWAIAEYPPAEIAAPFALMVIVLLIKPEGLYGAWGEIE